MHARTLAARVAARVATVGDSVVPVGSEATVVVWVEGARSEAPERTAEAEGAVARGRVLPVGRQAAEEVHQSRPT